MGGPDSQPSTTLCLTSAFDDLRLVYPWLDAVATTVVTPEILSAMHVVLEEAVANVVMHGFSPGQDGTIALRFAAEPGGVTLMIEDDGKAFDPSAAALPRLAGSLAEATVGGRGLTLIRRFCPAIAYERRDGRNHLRLRFTLPIG